MILINLLPPELRKARRSGINPVWFAAAAGLLICLGCASTWMWVRFSRIPVAEQLLATKIQELDDATAKAEKVRKLEAEITAFEQLHDRLTALITRKVFWARTLDDFANFMAQKNDSRLTMEGYDVRCTSLTIATASAPAATRGGGGAGETVLYSFRANLRIYGDEQDRAGDYTKSFFQSVELSRFWREYGFVGMAEAPYKGDQPRWNPDIHRVVIDMPLEWQRAKVLTPRQPQGVER